MVIRNIVFIIFVFVGLFEGRGENSLCFFNEYVIATNIPYSCSKILNDSCIRSARTSKIKIVTDVGLEHAEVRLAESMAYLFLRYANLRCRQNRFDKYTADADIISTFDRLPVGGEIDFLYLGYYCSEYTLTMIPFEIFDEMFGSRMKIVLCKFYADGMFRFAIYTNFNTLIANPEFKSTASRSLLFDIATYPFISDSEYKAQKEYVIQNSGGPHGH